MKLGKLEVSPTGFGCMGMTAFYGPAMANSDGVALLQAVHSAGCTHFDTAEAYQQFGGAIEGTFHFNEELVGTFLRTLPRESYTIATKFAPRLHQGKCDYETVSAAVDASLARLGLEAVDLYYCHRPPETVELLEEWMASIARVVASGRVRHVGLSEVPPSWLRRAHAVHAVACVQQEWSLLTRNLEKELVPTCVELDVGVVAYSPLARSLLTTTSGGPPKDWRSDHPRFADEANLIANRALAAEVATLAEAKGCSAAQLCLAWLTHRAASLGVGAIAIPGTTKVANALSNIAAHGVRLSAEDAASLEMIGATVAGARANDAYLQAALEGTGSSPQ